jgi:hypothetical protein
MNNCNQCNTEENGAIKAVYFVPNNEFYGFTADEMVFQIQNALNKYAMYNRKDPDFILMHPDAVKFLIRTYFDNVFVKPKRIYKPKMFGVKVYRTKDINPTSVKIF